MSKIKVGQPGLFYPHRKETIPHHSLGLSAIVSAVHNDGEVDLTITDVNGTSHSRSHVTVLVDANQPFNRERHNCFIPEAPQPSLLPDLLQK